MKQDIQTNLTIKVVIVLAIMAITTIVFYFKLKEAIEEKEHDSVILNLAGFQRANIQSYTRQINLVLISLAASDWSNLLDRKKVAQQIAKDFEHKHQVLKSGGSLKFNGKRVRVPSPHHARIINQLDEVWDEWQELERITNLGLRSQSQKLKKNQLLDQIQSQSLKVTLSMNGAVTLMQEESEYHHRKILIYKKFSTTILVILILGCGIFIHRKIIKPLAHNIRDLNQLSQETENERHWFEVMISSIGDAVIATDQMGTVTFINNEAEKLTGWRKDEVVLTKNIEEIFKVINKNNQKGMEEPIKKIFEKGETITLTNDHIFLIRKDGVEFPINENRAPILDLEGNIMGSILVFSDMSEKYNRDEEQRRLNQIIEATPDLIAMATGDGQPFYMNKAGRELLEIESVKELYKTKVFDFHPPEMAERLKNEIFPTVIQKGVWSGEGIFLTKNGTEIITSMVILGHKDADGNVQYLSTISRDIRGAKNMESQLRNAQKLEAVGQLAAGIAHEINTPIQYVGDNIRFLQDSFLDLNGFLIQSKNMIEAIKEKESLINDEVWLKEEANSLDSLCEKMDFNYLNQEIPQAIEHSLDGISRVCTIVNAMKEFSHPGVKNKIQVDLNHSIETIITVARNEWKYFAEINLDLDPDLPFVKCLPNEINQVLLNLIINASHAIEEKFKEDSQNIKGIISIQTKHLDNYVEISIKDNGIGIPREIQDKVFEPFFTTKKIGKGTGQGLSMAFQMIKEVHHGKIFFESKQGEGTTFFILLPISHEEIDTRVINETK